MSRKSIFLLAVFTLTGVLVYLVAAAWVYRMGFPLDDAWIHLTYARNLALLGEWSFLPGQSSAGSTSPLWTALLAIGFFLPGAPYLWTYFLGGLMLFLLAWRVEVTLRQLHPAYTSTVPWAGLVLLFEWHLAWAAVSGMEIILHALLITTTLSFLLLNQPRFLLAGFLAGLSIWSRPDGLTLLGPLLLFALLNPKTWRERARSLALILAGFLALFIPYLLFNFILSGTPWPNTFYAKQAEYASWLAQPFHVKLLELFKTAFIGVTLPLLPALLLLLYQALKKRNWAILLLFTWLAGYAWLYTSRLPLYQYGRYIMPAIPVFILLAMVYLLAWLPSVRTRFQRQIRFSWLTFLSMLLFSLWVYGASLYANNVAWIESEMVQTARWTAQNLPDEALVAVHDIGAIGYFDSRLRIIDLAGLISPDVIPFIRDEERLERYLNEQNVSHLIIFPGWYPLLSQKCQPIFEADGPAAGQSQSGRMTVYSCLKP